MNQLYVMAKKMNSRFYEDKKAFAQSGYRCLKCDALIGNVLVQERPYKFYCYMCNQNIIREISSIKGIKLDSLLIDPDRNNSSRIALADLYLKYKRNLIPFSEIEKIEPRMEEFIHLYPQWVKALDEIAELERKQIEERETRW